MQDNLQSRIVFYVFSLFVSIRLVLLVGCESDLTDALEGRPCTPNHKCLTGYVCDEDANVCVLETLSEKDTIKKGNADDRDRDGSTSDPSVDATTRESDSATSNEAEDINRIDATARESDSTINSNDNEDADTIVAILPQSDASAVDRSIDSHFVIDSGDTTGQDGAGDVNEAGGAGGSSDSGGFPDTGIETLICGRSIEPTATGCPDACHVCENGVCHIVCDDEQLCDKDTITCPLDFNCEVHCSNKQACEKTTIECPEQNACIVNCTGESSCEKATIKCYKGPCELRCQTGALACNKADLKCGIQKCKASCGPGQDPPNVIDCDVSCSTDCGC